MPVKVLYLIKLWQKGYGKVITDCACMSRDMIRCSLALVCVHNKSMKTIVTGHSEVQSYLERHWTEHIPLMAILSISYINE